MEPEWPVRLLKDVAAELTVGYVGPMAEQYTNDGVLFLRSLNIRPFALDTTDVKYISDDFHAKISKSSLRAGDVVIVRTGRPGTCAVIPGGLGEVNCSDLVIVRCGEALRPHFLCYWVNAIGQRHVAAYSVGAVQQHFNVASAKLIELPVPSLFDQDRVLSILRALDDRIDNLRATNATLETIAQALFKSWFVDFDPVHAKAEGRAPAGMDAATAALFPSAFEDSELGPIPKGWHVCTVADIAAVIRGRSYKSSELAESDVALVTLKSFERGGGFRRDGFKSYTGAFKPEQVLHEGDCIVACTDVTQRAELIGRAALVTASPDHSKLVASLDVAILHSTQPGVSSVFLVSLLAGSRYVSHVLGHATGTTVLHLSRGAVPNYKFACPPPSLLAAYTSLASVMFQQRATNVQREEMLADLRDILLPRLISGKLRLPDAAAEIAAAGA